MGVALSQAPPIGGFPFPGYAAGVMFIVGFGFLVRRFAGMAASLIHRILADRLPAEARLALQTVEGRLPRLSVAVTSLMIAVAMLVSVAIMVSSFRDTIVVWVDQTLGGDLYLRPPSPGSDGGRNVMDPGIPETIAGLPGVAAIERFRSVSIRFGGFPAIMAGSDLETLAARSRLLFLDGRDTPEVVEQLVGNDRVVVSEPFAVRHGIAADDTILLPARDGDAAFQVEAVFYDYSSEGGLVVMDRGTWIRHMDDEAVSTIAVYLESGWDLSGVRQSIAGVVGARARISANASIRDQILRVFDQTFEVTYALEAIALAVAMLGIANTLAALVLERRPELAMLRFVGTSRKQIRRMLVLEAGFVGVLGILMGLALGFLLSLLLVHVINFQSFGWTIQFALPAGFLVQAVLAVLAATLAAGFYPAALALRVDPLRGIRAE
jgi:putative ABC transport system permease protein